MRLNVVIVLLIGMVCSCALSAADAGASVNPATIGILDSLWQYVNSAPGVAVLIGIITWILGRVFASKPQWKTIYEKYFPAIMSAVKQAEKAIPDDTPSKGLARADWALKKLVEMEPALASVPAPVIRAAIDVAHASAEANENI